MDDHTQEKIMGTVIFGQPVSGIAHDTVARAASNAGIPANLVRDLRPQYAFIRAMQEMKKNGVVRGDFTDNHNMKETIQFSFVSRVAETEYKAEAVVEYNKESQQVRVIQAPPLADPRVIKERAEKMIVRAKSIWLCSDINTLVKRYLNPLTKKIPLRPGVAFIPATAQGASGVLEKFYKELGFSFWLLPVGYGEEKASDIKEAAATQLRNEMARLAKKVSDLKASGGLTKRIAKRQLADLRAELVQYHAVAQSIQAEFGDIAGSAGDLARTLTQVNDPIGAILEQVRSGDAPEVLVDLVLATSDEFEPIGEIESLRREVNLCEVVAGAKVVQAEKGEQLELFGV